MNDKKESITTSIKTFNLDLNHRGCHITGILKVINERTFVSIMLRPFEGLTWIEHFYGFDDRHYDFSDDAVKSRAGFNLQRLYEKAICVFQQITEYRKVMVEAEAYQKQIAEKCEVAEKVLKTTDNKFDKEALRQYLEALIADGKNYFKWLMAKRSLPQDLVNQQELKQILEISPWQ